MKSLKLALATSVLLVTSVCAQEVSTDGFMGAKWGASEDEVVVAMARRGMQVLKQDSAAILFGVKNEDEVRARFVDGRLYEIDRHVSFYESDEAAAGFYDAWYRHATEALGAPFLTHPSDGRMLKGHAFHGLSLMLFDMDGPTRHLRLPEATVTMHASGTLPKTKPGRRRRR